jgi:ABC-2 type transport system ATP-binding protein
MTYDLAVETAGLTKAFGGDPVLGGVDLAVPGGTVFGLLGPNGAGKTTIVRILATLLRADAGTAHVAGFDIAAQRHEVRRRSSLTGQHAAVDEFQTGVENLRMMGRLSGLDRRGARRRAAELLDRFDLAAVADRRVATYSGGTRRRLDLAAGLVGTPAVLFLDEPTTGLDPRSRAELWQIIEELVTSGVTVFLTTQYLEEADRLADRIALMDRGRIVAEGTAGDLKQGLGDHRLDLVLADDRAFEDVSRSLAGRVTSAERDRLELTVPTDGTASQVRSLLDEIDPTGTAVARFTVHTATLDDVFLALTGRTTTDTNTTEAKEPTHV